MEIVRELPKQVTFKVLPPPAFAGTSFAGISFAKAGCWVAEQILAWVNCDRRLAKGFEATIASATAFLNAACVMLLTRRLARSA